MNKRFKLNKLFFLVCLLIVYTVCFVGCEFLFSSELILDTSEVNLTIEQGESFDYDAIKIYVEQNGKKRQLELTEVVIGKLDTTILGTHRVYVVYGKLKAFFSVTITTPALGELYLDTDSLPQKVHVNQLPDLSQVKASIMVDGKTITVPYDQLIIKNFDNSDVGQTSITLAYKKDYRVYQAVFEILVYEDLPKAEYIQVIIEQMQSETENILLEKTGNKDYRYSFLEEDYKNSFGALFDKVKAELTVDKTTQELDAILELFKLSLEQCVKNTKTAVDRVKEFNESLDFSKLTKESKLQVERLFSVALEQMASFDGGAPSLDYIFYQLTLNVNFYFV